MYKERGSMDEKDLLSEILKETENQTEILREMKELLEKMEAK